ARRTSGPPAHRRRPELRHIGGGGGVAARVHRARTDQGPYQHPGRPRRRPARGHAHQGRAVAGALRSRGDRPRRPAPVPGGHAGGLREDRRGAHGTRGHRDDERQPRRSRSRRGALPARRRARGGAGDPV
ncbi:MAG: hypothetical protein AVDCRST_MAG69-640, partial [uncultured Solirubrobacteraceae bacterium]